jgi:plastocyanin
MAQTHNIEITQMSFPPNTPVAKGDSVTWTNRMNMQHTVTGDNGEFDSGNLAKDQSFTHTFDADGTVAYHCEIHPFMTGVVTVAAGAAAGTTHNIEITEMAFPDDTPVAAGDTVTWTNRMDMNHTVTARNGEFDSGVLGLDQSFSHTFPAAGAVPYRCKIHPNMKGTVTVT